VRKPPLGVLTAIFMAIATTTVAAQEPLLPTGLGLPDIGSSTPALPEGLAGEKDEVPVDPTPPDSFDFLHGLTGFMESRIGIRTQEDAHQKTASIGEARLQIEGEWEADWAVFHLTTDFLYDTVSTRRRINLERGRGWVDLREANVLFRPLPFADIKAGRQILTWGTGDLVFINDLFPKDFQSFFSGRDDEYLKSPSDAVRVSLFHDAANLDIVYTPRFDADRFIDGSRLSFYSPALGRIVGRNAIVDPLFPDTWFSDDEIALRLYRNVQAFEVAAYFYNGFWKNPQGQTPDGIIVFPNLRVLGASLRGPLYGGIVNLEFGHYDSTEDRQGSNPLIPNGQWRYLIGYEREIMPEFTVAVQYYDERTQDFDAFQKALPAGLTVGDRTRHVLTLRLTKLLLHQTLTLSAFNFWSPNESDGHLRLRASYKATDSWLLEIGSNVFYGDADRFFGQFKDNTNLFLALRQSF